MKRRHFLTAAAALAGVPVGAAFAQQRGARKLGNIGVQLYTLRQMMEKDVGRTLEAVAKAGYTEVEFAGYFNVNPPVMKIITVHEAYPGHYIQFLNAKRFPTKTRSMLSSTATSPN